jgi:hypothetical protein
MLALVVAKGRLSGFPQQWLRATQDPLAAFDSTRRTVPVSPTRPQSMTLVGKGWLEGRLKAERSEQWPQSAWPVRQVRNHI